MFFKKKKDNVRRCQNGHLMEPDWQVCHLCESTYDDSGEFLNAGDTGVDEQEIAPPAPAYPPPLSPPPPAPAHKQMPPPPPPQAAPRYDNTPDPGPAPGTPPPIDPNEITQVGAAPAAPRPADSPIRRRLVTGNDREDVRPSVNPVAAQDAGIPPASPAPPPPPAAAPQAPPSQPPPDQGMYTDPEKTQILGTPAGTKNIVAWLVVTSRTDAGRDFRLPSGTFRIGIGDTCELHIQGDDCVSRQHAEIRYTNGQFLLRDLNSTNGTKLNGQLISEGVLQNGDKLRFGETDMVFVCVDI